MRGKLMMLLCMSLFFATGALAQELPGAAKEAEVRRLLDSMGFKKMMDALIPQMMTQMRQQADQMAKRQFEGTSTPADIQEKLKEMRELMFARLTEEFQNFDMEGITARIYAKYFTLEEIQELAKFYESPVGKKMLEMTPRIMQDSMSETQAQSQQMLAKLMKELKEKFPEIFNPPTP